jgi:hypothetical protein
VIPALALWFEVEVAPMCYASDIKALCCPSACAVRRSSRWEHANDVLRACMRGIGCGSESKSATVGMRCDCSNR